MSRQPLAILAVFFMVGIVIQEYLALPANQVLIVFLASLLLIPAVFLRKIFVQRIKPFIYMAVAMVWGLSLHHLKMQTPDLPDLSGKTEVMFSLNRKLNSNENNRRYEVTFLNANKEYGAVFSIPRDMPELDFAHSYKAEINLHRIKPPANDYQFNFAKYMSRKDVYFQGYLAGKLFIAERRDLSLPEKIQQHRTLLLQKINASAMSPRSSEFMKGIILADRTEMDRATVDDFSRTGLVHILAISGSHIVIIFGIVFLVMKNMLKGKYRKYAVLISLLFIWMFAVYIGLGSSVVRACLMLTAYSVFQILQRKKDLLHAMALAAFCILLADTHQLFDVGFQLSFVAVLGIFWLNKPLLKFFPEPKNKMQRWIYNIPSITLSAQLMTLPLVIYYFHQFSAVSLLANFVIIPFSEVVIIGSLLLTLLIGAGINLNWLERIYDLLITKLLEVIHWFAGIESGFNSNVPMHWLEVIFLFAAVYYFGFFLRFHKRKTGWKLAFALMLFFGCRWMLDIYFENKSEAVIHEQLRYSAVSLKEGNSVIFYIPQTADRDNFLKFVVNPYLTSRRTGTFEIRELPENTGTVNWKGRKIEVKNPESLP